MRTQLKIFDTRESVKVTSFILSLKFVYEINAFSI